MGFPAINRLIRSAGPMVKPPSFRPAKSSKPMHGIINRTVPSYSYGGRRHYSYSSSSTGASGQHKPNKIGWSCAAAGAGLVGLALAYHQSNKLREIALEELERHNTLETGLWIAWQDPDDQKWYVSAMADFVNDHPGGDRILEAGGKAAMPYWQQFAKHLSPSGAPSPKVLKELRKRIVGVLTEAPPNAKIADPYAVEPNREKYSTYPLQERPYNAGQKPENLTEFFTEEDDLFVRFHTPAPLLQNYTLAFETPEGSRTFNLDSLRQFQTASYASVIQCTGHRRSEMPNTNGLQWDSAVGNVNLTGYLLWDILGGMGVQPEKGKFLLVQQLDPEGKELFSTCIPLDLLPKNSLLATQMNGRPLTRDHGGPLRLWIPGFNGNFLVKKPDHFKVVTAEAAPADKVQEYAPLGSWAVPAAMSNNLRAYIAKDKSGRISFEPKLRVNSLIQSGKAIKVPAGTTEVPLQGWAWSGGAEIAAVEFSLDGGQTWKRAALNPIIDQPRGERYAWTAWNASVPIVKPRTEVLVRATDAMGNVQPAESIWNERGLRVNHQSKTVIEVSSF